MTDIAHMSPSWLSRGSVPINAVDDGAEDYEDISIAYRLARFGSAVCARSATFAAAVRLARRGECVVTESPHGWLAVRR